MNTKEQARRAISNLVTQFRANEPLLGETPEAQIENDYIRPLFEALNWNTNNQGLPFNAYEFLLQRTDDKGTRPDYLVQLEGKKLFVIEAKAIKHKMTNEKYLWQAYTYAYGTQGNPTPDKIDFAILTDFQEFILLDCTLNAENPTVARNFRILDWKYTDYIDQFDTLWELFEHENVRAALEHRGTKKPIGLWKHLLSPKQVKANRIAPDEPFLKKMDDPETGWRVRLAKDMKKQNPEATGDLITTAVQLLIDRLIFIKALSDREIEENYLEQLERRVEQAGLGDHDTGWFVMCRDIFEKLNLFYNGSIFEPRPELESATFSNKVVRSIINELRPENTPYNFASMPVEILGTIYERFLGRVVRTTDKRVTIEYKPEYQKTQGTFYTPRFIVDYIVGETVGRLLAQCKTPTDVARLKIIDPACGSGSFLLGAYAKLIEWYEAYYATSRNRSDRENVYRDKGGAIRLTARLKRQILMNNIFGVDIDPQAVEVTRFSLSLKALENTRKDELQQEVTLYEQAVLPNLRDNIKCGNSLISTACFANQLQIDQEEYRRLNPFDWKVEFSAIIGNGGFDAVIGNPPWVLVSGPLEKSILENVYRLSTGKRDLYRYFMELAFQIVHRKGYFGFITPNTWMAIPAATPLRKFLLKEGGLRKIINFNGKVFNGVKANCTILIAHNRDSADVEVIEDRASLPNAGTLLAAATTPRSVEVASWQSNPNSEIFLSSSQPTDALILKVQAAGRSLNEVADYTLGMQVYHNSMHTKTQIKGRVFHSPTKRGNNYFPETKGRNTQRYHFNEDTEEFVVYDDNCYNKPNWRFCSGPRILVREIPGKTLVCCLTTNKHISSKAVIIVVPRTIDIIYLLGLLNSALFGWYIRAAGPKGEQNLYPRISLTTLRKLPIALPANNALITHVQSMIAAHAHLASAKTVQDKTTYSRQITTLDAQINALVYELYGLTKEEIAIVEASLVKIK